MSSDRNESDHPPLPTVAAAIASSAATANRYPEFHPDGLRRHLARHLGVTDGAVTVGAGATGVALAILQDLVLQARRTGCGEPRIATPVPTFDGFAIIARMLGIGVDATPLDPAGAPDLDALAAAVGPQTVAVIVCSPHNPTGAVVGDDSLRRFFASIPPTVTVILDQAYVEYCVTSPDTADLLARYSNLIVLRTFSKAYGLAALRVGYAFGRPDVIAGPRAQELPFAVGATAQVAAPIALAAQQELRARVLATRAERERLTCELRELGCRVLPSEANFVYLPGPTGLAVGRALRDAGVVGKEIDDHGFRLTVTDRATTVRIAAAVSDELVQASSIKS
ncbi:aminotransferase class I/II-fold pyridoxal phosphate-dependent enzyme [Gordonia sp. CPCC 205515]|uniref:pyridoxal phosphate-dependent aminotransferase n=1 Tax=Gordonia sp. CPCC 205515 TaxID=3140791 RepID=UPI003AF35A2D